MGHKKSAHHLLCLSVAPPTVAVFVISPLSYPSMCWEYICYQFRLSWKCGMLSCFDEGLVLVCRVTFIFNHSLWLLIIKARTSWITPTIWWLMCTSLQSSTSWTTLGSIIMVGSGNSGSNMHSFNSSPNKSSSVTSGKISDFSKPVADMFTVLRLREIKENDII